MIIVIINVSNGHTNSGTTGSIGINGIPIPIFKTKPKNITTFKLNGKKVGKLEVELKDNSNLIEVIKNIKNAKGFNDNMININAEYEDEQSNQTYKIETVKVATPQGYQDGPFCAYQKGQTTYNYFDRTEIHISLNNTVVGIMRKYEFVDINTKANYYYDVINWKGSNYYMYQVETASGYAYCIYKENTLVSIYDCGDRKMFSGADIYALDSEDTALLCILNGIYKYRYELSLQEERHLNRRRDETPNTNDSIPEEAKYIGSISLFLYDQSIFQNKYDPNFIENLKTK